MGEGLAGSRQTLYMRYPASRSTLTSRSSLLHHSLAHSSTKHLLLWRQGLFPLPFFALLQLSCCHRRKQRALWVRHSVKAVVGRDASCHTGLDLHLAFKRRALAAQQKKGQCVKTASLEKEFHRTAKGVQVKSQKRGPCS